MPVRVDYIAIGKRIRTLRQSKGWTQEELAKQCGTSTSYEGHLERATRIPSLETIVKIASSLDISLNELIHGSDNQTNPAATRKKRILNDIERVLREHIDEWLRDR